MSDNIQALIKFVNDQIKFHNSQSSRKKANGQHNNASKRHSETAKSLQQILGILERLELEDGFEPVYSNNNQDERDLFAITPDDIENMPEELRGVLNLQETDILESRVIKLLEIAGRPLSLKDLIMGLYRKYGFIVEERNPFASKLYRMKDSGQISSPKKGHYSLPNEVEDDVLDFNDN